MYICVCVYIYIYIEHIELPAKLLDYLLRSNKSNINDIHILVSRDAYLDTVTSYAYVYVSIYAYVYIYIRICAYIHAYTYTHICIHSC